jgi:hemoglobin-like flavoprotein
MIHTMALMANLSEDQAIIAPHMHKLGAAHKPFDLELRDMNNFKTVFIEMLGEQLGARWTAAAAQAWSSAFDEVLIPLMREGMKSFGAGASAAGRTRSRRS